MTERELYDMLRRLAWASLTFDPLGNVNRRLLSNPGGLAALDGLQDDVARTVRQVPFGRGSA